RIGSRAPPPPSRPARERASNAFPRACPAASRLRELRSPPRPSPRARAPRTREFRRTPRAKPPCHCRRDLRGHSRRARAPHHSRFTAPTRPRAGPCAPPPPRSAQRARPPSDRQEVLPLETSARGRENGLGSACPSRRGGTTNRGGRAQGPPLRSRRAVGGWRVPEPPEGDGGADSDGAGHGEGEARRDAEEDPRAGPLLLE